MNIFKSVFDSFCPFFINVYFIFIGRTFVFSQRYPPLLFPPLFLLEFGKISRTASLATYALNHEFNNDETWILALSYWNNRLSMYKKKMIMSKNFRNDNCISYIFCRNFKIPSKISCSKQNYSSNHETWFSILLVIHYFTFPVE